MKTLIVLHGWQSSKEKWEIVKKELENRGIKVVVPDIPGFKEETKLDRSWSLDDYVNWFNKTCGEFAEPFFLLGHSFGGRIAIKFAIENPEKLQGLILVSAAGIKSKKPPSFLLISAIAKIGRHLSFLPGFNFFKKFFYKFFVKTTDYFEAKGAMKETFKKIVGEDLTPFLSLISVPALIIWGEKDNITPLADAYLMKEKISNSVLKIIPEENHDLNIKVPEKISEIVSQFVLNNF